MEYRLKKSVLCAASTFLIVLTLNIWAASIYEAAHLYAQKASQTKNAESLERAKQLSSRLPATVRFREVEGRGLLVKTWINNVGPYTFVIDTGAGATILSQRVAREAAVAISIAREVAISGLSGASGGSGHEATIRSLAIGESNKV